MQVSLFSIRRHNSPINRLSLTTNTQQRITRRIRSTQIRSMTPSRNRHQQHSLKPKLLSSHIRTQNARHKVNNQRSTMTINLITQRILSHSRQVTTHGHILNRLLRHTQTTIIPSRIIQRRRHRQLITSHIHNTRRHITRTRHLTLNRRNHTRIHKSSITSLPRLLILTPTLRPTFRLRNTIRVLNSLRLMTVSRRRRHITTNLSHLISHMLSRQPISSQRRLLNRRLQDKRRPNTRANSKRCNLTSTRQIDKSITKR